MRVMSGTAILSAGGLLVLSAGGALLGGSAQAFLPTATRPTPILSFSASPLSNTRLFGILNRFRNKREVDQKNTIDVGDTLPSVDVQRALDGENVDILDISVGFGKGTGGGNKKSILVGMPGAFTPICTGEHLPGFIENADKFKELGYDTIAIMTTNDRFVNEEWIKSVGLDTQKPSKADNSDDSSIIAHNEEVKAMLRASPVTVLCDADGDLVKEMGLAEDMGFGVGIRSKRFVLTADENGKVTNLLTDAGMDDCSCTSAANLIKVLSPDGAVGAAGDGMGMDPAILGGVAIIVGAGYFFATQVLNQ